MTTNKPSPTKPTKTSKNSVELDESLYDQLDAEIAAEEAAEYDDFDKFWASRTKVRPARIRGVIVTPPTDVPLNMIDELAKVQASEDERDVKRMVASIFGGDVFDQWYEAGMGIEEFQVILAWAGAAMRGQPVTFAEAVDIYRQMLEQQAAQGKARKPPKAKGGRQAARRSRSK